LSIRYLHAHDPPLVHADLKSPNILVDVNWRCKVADLGLAKLKIDVDLHSGEGDEVQEGEGGGGGGSAEGGGAGPSKAAAGSRRFRSTKQQRGGNNGSSQTQQTPGSLLWCAPEVFEHEPVTSKSDVYSFAIVMFEVLFRRLPFFGTNAVAVPLKVFEGARPTAPPPPGGLREELGPVWQQLTALMAACWHQRPSHRPSLEHVLAQLDGFAQSFVGQQNWEGSVTFPVTEARDSDAAMGGNAAGMIGAAAAAAAAAAAGSAGSTRGGGSPASTPPLPKSSAAPAKAAAAAAAGAAKPTVPGKLHGAAPSYGIAGADDGSGGTDSGTDGDGGGSAAAASASAAAAQLPPDTTFLVERSITSAVRQVRPLVYSL
jgi:serine/threonine protein kinase